MAKFIELTRTITDKNDIKRQEKTLLNTMYIYVIVKSEDGKAYIYEMYNGKVRYAGKTNENYALVKALLVNRSYVDDSD